MREWYIDISYWPFLLLFIPVWVILWANKVEAHWVLLKNKRVFICFYIIWFDFWIGLFRKPNGHNYIFFWPMFGFGITFYKQSKKVILADFKKAEKEVVEQKIKPKTTRVKGPDGICCCSAMASGGDMSPRLWWCELHGGSGFVGPMVILDQLAIKYNLYRDECWEAMYEFLEYKREEKKKKGDIYFCEDYYVRDATEEFLGNNTSKYISKRL